jgi:glycosyltransferase involved in cell wall biosynthesis
MLDVVFLCEGTYPFVPGGVSSWIHSLIVGMPDLKFGIVYLAPSAKDNLKLRYQIPSNVLDLVVVPLYDITFKPQSSTPFQSQVWEEVAPFVKGILRGEAVGFATAFRHLSPVGDRQSTLTVRELANSEQAWELLTEAYRASYPKSSFNDFFWSWRYAFLPLFKLCLAEVPPARLYHTVTTGWSGLLASVAARRKRRPFITTEHGLYVNERRIEISQADWIFVDAPRRGALEIGLGTFKEIWINLFLGLGKLCYQETDRIYTLFEGNLRKEVEFGAPEEKIEIVPNGVDVDVFSAQISPALTPDPNAFRVGLVGRVVPIKDIKTFIKSVRFMKEQIPGLEVYVLGPTDEDEDYFAECETMCGALGLHGVIRFTGQVDMKAWYPALDVQVLTSISEGQPLVLLEGFCSGLPAVASDVGACREVIEGRSPEDRALGAAGTVTWVGNARQTAEAVIALQQNPAQRKRMGEAGKARVNLYYRRDQMLQTYRSIYAKYMAVPNRDQQPAVKF